MVFRANCRLNSDYSEKNLDKKNRVTFQSTLFFFGSQYYLTTVSLRASDTLLPATIL
jgi:hypothetical protein